MNDTRPAAPTGRHPKAIRRAVTNEARAADNPVRPNQPDHTHEAATMTEQQRHNDREAAKDQRAKARKALKRLSPAEIARRTERQRPAIARDAAHRGTGTQRRELETPALPEPEHGVGVVLAHPSSALVTAVDGERSESRTQSGAANDGTKPTQVRDEDRSEDRVVGPRQMTIWETAKDAEIIAGWVTASTRRDRLEQTEDPTQAAEDVADWRVATPTREVDPLTRRDLLRNVTTRDDLHLVQQVRAAVVDLVLEHPFQSEEADRRLVAHGIRFGVWTLSKTPDGKFDPFRDLTEDRITRFVRDAGPHLSTGSQDTYAAALRRLAAGPVIRHRGERRKAVAPLPRAIEDGLWTAADSYSAGSWQHQEAKTLLALSFGAGASSEEINMVAPDDVLVQRGPDGLRVSVRLMREKTWVRDVPVLQARYADWLAKRSAQVAGHAYLFKPDRVSRANAINSATRRLAETNHAFERFRIHAARNTCAVTWLQAGVPFAEWANAAGVGPGTHLPTDLLAYMPTPEPSDVEAAFRRAALRRPPSSGGR